MKPFGRGGLDGLSGPGCEFSNRLSGIEGRIPRLSP